MRTELNESWLVELTPAVVGCVPVIMSEVRDLLRRRDPESARFLEEEFDEVTVAAEDFMAHLVDAATRDTGAGIEHGYSGIEETLFEEIGRRQCQAGRPVTSLLITYRISARVAWRHVADASLRVDAPKPALAALGSALFAAIDQLSDATLRGYLEEHSAEISRRERLRDELAELLLSGRADTAAIEAAAHRAGWALPQQAAVVIVDPDNEVARAELAGLPDSCLRLWRSDVVIAIVPDPFGPGHRARLAAALRGAGAVVGAGVALEQLPAAMPAAEIAVRLRRAGVLDDDPVFVDEHLDAIIVHRDDCLLGALRERCLAPLAGVSDPTRRRLTTTLTAWLRNMTDRKAIAAELHVHPQTVNYRLGQLRELFGSSLDDLDFRAELFLALAWGPPGSAHADPPNRRASAR